MQLHTKITKKTTKIGTQIRINRTVDIDRYLLLAKQKYKVLDDNEIIKMWISKGISDDFDGGLDSNLLAKQAVATFAKDEGDQDDSVNYNSGNVKQINW